MQLSLRRLLQRLERHRPKLNDANEFDMLLESIDISFPELEPSRDADGGDDGDDDHDEDEVELRLPPSVPSQDSVEGRRAFVLQLLSSLALDAGFAPLLVRWMLQPFLCTQAAPRHRTSL